VTQDVLDELGIDAAPVLRFGESYTGGRDRGGPGSRGAGIASGRLACCAAHHVGDHTASTGQDEAGRCVGKLINGRSSHTGQPRMQVF
jgi:hypothetical protein